MPVPILVDSSVLVAAVFLGRISNSSLALPFWLEVANDRHHQPRSPRNCKEAQQTPRAITKPRSLCACTKPLFPSILSNSGRTGHGDPSPDPRHTLAPRAGAMGGDPEAIASWGKTNTPGQARADLPGTQVSIRIVCLFVGFLTFEIRKC